MSEPPVVAAWLYMEWSDELWTSADALGSVQHVEPGASRC